MKKPQLIKSKLALIGATALIGLSSNQVQAARRLGNDVSSYQDSTQSYFRSIKSKGAKFVIVKLGGSGGAEGYHYQNPKASAQLANAKAAGLDVGGYYWGQFGASTSSAKSMAKMAISDAKKFGLETGSVIALDYEAGASSSKPANTTAIVAFMSAIKSAGYKPILYSGSYYFKQYVDVDKVGGKYGDVIWVASYKTMGMQTKPDFNYFPSMPHVGLWQYADNWYGIDGNVELKNNLVTSGKVAKKTPVKPANATTNKQLGVQPIPKSNKYTIKQGDSWYSIATRYGLDAGLLARLNGKTEKSTIHPRQVIKLTGVIKVQPKQAKKTTAKKAATKKPTTVTVKPGIVQAKWLGYGKTNWKIRLINGKGYYTNTYVKQLSRWKYSKINSKGYLIGRDLWLPKNYATVVK